MEGDRKGAGSEGEGEGVWMNRILERESEGSESTDE